MKTQKVSYLIALYNKEKYISEAIDSILNDSTQEIDIEICIVDDGSTDESAKIIKEKYSNNPKIKFESLGSNKGKNTAYNKAYTMSTGEYISLIGADDTIINGRTKKLLERCAKTGLAAYGGFIKKFEGTDRTETHHINKKATFNKNIIQNQLPGGCFMMPRKLAESIFPIPEHLKYEDWWISFHLLRNKKVQITEDLVLFYRIHEENNWDTSVISREAQIKKHYLRDIPYLEEFTPFLRNTTERNSQKRSLAIRLCHIGEKPYTALLYPPYNKSWLKLLANLFLSPSTLHHIGKKIKASSPFSRAQRKS